MKPSRVISGAFLRHMEDIKHAEVVIIAAPEHLNKIREILGIEYEE